MPTTLTTAVSNYLRSGKPARGTQVEYQTTLRKWKQWGGGMPIEKLGRKEIREFLDWVYDLAVAEHGTNPGRTANKAREHLRAVISWAWGSAAWLQQSLRASVRHTDARWATRDRRNAIERAKKSSRVAHTEKRPIAVLCADASKAGVGTMIRNNNPRTSPKNRCG